MHSVQKKSRGDFRYVEAAHGEQHVQGLDLDLGVRG